MRKYYRTIFFTKVPLGGQYRYKDIFQIFPADLENIPKSSFQKDYPNILEYWTTEDEIVSVSTDFEEIKELIDKTAAQLKKQNKILNLLSVFSNNHFFVYYNSGGQWGMPMLTDTPGPESNNWSAKWCLPLFYFPKMAEQLSITEFSKQNLPEIERIEHKAFYTHDPNIDFDSEKNIVLPTTIDSLFDRYFALENEVVPIVDTAISYAVSAIELKDEKKTLSLLSSFTALETMVNLEYRDVPVEKCDACGQSKFSVASKFRNYLLNCIGDSEANKKKFNSYYSLRSKIVHTGRQLKTEILFSDVPKSEQDKEFLTRIEILQIGKLGIVNWLLKNSRYIKKN